MRAFACNALHHLWEVTHTGFEIITARAKCAAGGPFARQGQLAAYGHQWPGKAVSSWQRKGLQQAIGVGMAHMVEDLSDVAKFNRLAGIHHANTVTRFKDQAKIM